ncbi:hypothetical protein CPB83DRAFT_858859 [Crepidotus variabilis]|uniref:BTB domain-containing protein n=1 Tax=Crepidotus variabilis TaxID=179855 RepID=A0A9P6JMJ1_9AGAR|nr:hypothetical protein CPB83DRAFT_858859 [Crepidotus variabilis]
MDTKPKASSSLDGGYTEERHALYYWDLVVFRVEKTAFRIPTYGFLSSNKNFFENLQSSRSKVENDGQEYEQVDVYELESVNKNHFEGLLLVLYPRGRTAETYEEWIGALHLATLWDLHDIRTKAIEALERSSSLKSKNPVEVALLAKKYGVGSWLCNAYTNLVQRTDLSINLLRPSTNEEDCLDWITVSHIFEAQSLLKTWPDDLTALPTQCGFCANRRSLQEGPNYHPTYTCPFHLDATTCVKKTFHEEFVLLDDNVPGPLPLAPSGIRLAMTSKEFSLFKRLGESKKPLLKLKSPCDEGPGRYVYIGSILKGRAVLPCKIIPWLGSGYRVITTLHGKEYFYEERRFDLLLYSPDQMEWVAASHGRVPAGRIPIEGGHEENGDKLYHALGVVDGISVPGKTGPHLGCASIPFKGEKLFHDNYSILCWR